MKYYWFEDYHLDKEFLVGANSKDEAYAVAEEIFQEPALIDKLSEEKAIASNLEKYYLNENP